MEKLDPWHVMATHVIHYEGEEGKVEVAQMTGRTPEFFFLVRFPGREILLTRFAARPELWYGSPITMAKAKVLGESIEWQIGYRLPPKACNNPFQYTGDIAINIERFQISKLLIERAKAPYTNDIFYRMSFSKERSFVMVNMDILGERSWTYEGVYEMDENDFDLSKSLLIAFEEAYQRGIYTPEQ